MAYEILNNSTVTPARLHALLRLVSRLQVATRQDLRLLLQPPALADDPKNPDHKSADAVFIAALTLGLIQQGEVEVVRLAVERDTIESPGAFRATMQGLLCGVAESDKPNYLLNEYVAWYAAQDARIFRFENEDFDTRFWQDLYASQEQRPFNATKLNGWRTWAAYLGWGWPLPRSSRSELLVPDAYTRLCPIVQQIVPQKSNELRFADFAAAIADRCPELDGGDLFERCWDASRKGDARGNRVSLMLSTALRGLHDSRRIELVRRPDATDTWQLFWAEGHAVNEVTHVRPGR